MTAPLSSDQPGGAPAAADLAEILTGSPAEFPAAAIAIIGLGGDWPDLPQDGGAGQLVAAWTPPPES